MSQAQGEGEAARPPLPNSSSQTRRPLSRLPPSPLLTSLFLYNSSVFSLLSFPLLSSSPPILAALLFYPFFLSILPLSSLHLFSLCSVAEQFAASGLFSSPVHSFGPGRTDELANDVWVSI